MEDRALLYPPATAGGHLGKDQQLVHSLQEWCKQAEASGVRELEDLSVRVRRYVI